MRCVKCEHSCYYYPDNKWECPFGFTPKADKNKEYGCNHNKQTIDKIKNRIKNEEKRR